MTAEKSESVGSPSVRGRRGGNQGGLRQENSRYWMIHIKNFVPGMRHQARELLELLMMPNPGDDTVSPVEFGKMAEDLEKMSEYVRKHPEVNHNLAEKLLRLATEIREDEISLLKATLEQTRN
jgi:hypothetical protein